MKVDLSSIPVGKHVESDISFSENEQGEIRVLKCYRQENECIRWLNQHLAKYYDPANGLPVAQHEFAALSLLSNYDVAPAPLELRPDSILMTFAGSPLTSRKQIGREAYAAQSSKILSLFHEIDFHHNDMLPRNVLIHEGRLRVVDFTLSEFCGIQIAASLPDSRWARIGEDAQLKNYYLNLQNPLLQKLLDIKKAIPFRL